MSRLVPRAALHHLGAVALTLAAALALVAPARAEIDIEVVTSPGGITAWLYEERSIPMLSIEASFRGGAVLDPEGQEGAAYLMASLLEEGAGDLDATAFAVARDDLAAQFSFSARQDEVSVAAQMLSESRDEAVDLLRRAIAEPRFDEAAFERVQGQILSSLRGDQTDPDDIVGKAYYAQAFPGHPYARPHEGTLESVAALDLDAIRAIHAATMVRDRLMVAVVGDIDAEELGPLLDRLFGDLPQNGGSLPSVAEAQAPGTLQVIDLAIPQSVVMFGHGGIPRDDPDFIPAFVMDHILGGGGFGSRLTEEVREKRGLTYGVYTYLAPSDYGWLYLGRFSSANERVAEAIEIVRDEWARMAKEGVTEAELEDAKRYLTGAYPLRFDGNGRIAGQLLGLQTAGLGPEYVNERNELIEAVTLEDIRRVAARILRPEELTWIVVGRPEGLEATN